MAGFRVSGTLFLFNDRLLKIKLDGSLLDPLRQFITDKEYVKYYVSAVVGGKVHAGDVCRLARRIRPSKGSSSNSCLA